MNGIVKGEGVGSTPSPFLCAAVTVLVPDPVAVPPLAEVPIFTGFARAVVEGVGPGRVWGDDRAAHAFHHYGMSLVWGAGLGAAFPAFAAHLREGTYRNKDEWLQIDPHWDHLGWDQALGVGRGAAERFTRLNFVFDRTLFEARHGRAVPPTGWQLQKLDRSAFERDGITVSPHFFWKDYAAFCDHGGGIAAWRGGELGAYAFSATRFDDWLEIGIETVAAYRGQGLARAVAVAMIARCLAQGLTPVWACRKENTASWHLAESLGFVVTKDVPFYRLAAV